MQSDMTSTEFSPMFPVTLATQITLSCGVQRNECVCVMHSARARIVSFKVVSCVQVPGGHLEVAISCVGNDGMTRTFTLRPYDQLLIASSL